MGVERVPHGQHNVEAEEEVQGERNEFKELQEVEVRCAQHVNSLRRIHRVESCGLKEAVKVEVADELCDLHLGDHGLPGDNAFAEAHVVDKFVRVRHELLVVAHHDCNRTGYRHRNHAKEARKCDHLALFGVPLETATFDFLTSGRWIVVEVSFRQLDHLSVSTNEIRVEVKVDLPRNSLLRYL